MTIVLTMWGEAQVPAGSLHNRVPFACRRHTAYFEKMAVAERKEAEPTTQHRNEVGLAVR